MIRRIAQLPLTLLPLLLLAACAGDKDTPYAERPVEQLYNDAADKLAGEDYAEAAKLFDETERQHPYSQWATRAQLMSAYALYEGEKYDEAVAALDRFIQLHPGHERVDYAYYLRALSYYDQITDIRRDQRITELATDGLNEVVRRFPASDYARDAKVKLDLTRDHLAGKEMEIGRFYLYRNQYQAAINRFRKVVEDYQTTSHTPEALHRLVESYVALGLKDEARKYAAVLGANYPGSSWYQDSYALMGEDPANPPQQPKGFDGKAVDWVF